MVVGIIATLVMLLFSLIPVLIIVALVFLFVVAPIMMMFFKVVYQFERGILFSFGKYIGIVDPGLRVIIPFIQEMRKVDMRITTIDVPRQEVITKDNVPVGIDAVVYFRVISPENAVLKMEDYTYAVAKYAQTALRDVVGNSELDTLLTQREQVAEEIEGAVDKETKGWGIDVTAIKLQDIELPADMKRSMARQAEAEREKRATIIMSEGEVAASNNLAEAAKKLGTTPGAMHLRTLQTLGDVSSDQTNEIIMVTPVEMLRAIEGFGALVEQMKKGKE